MAERFVEAKGFAPHLLMKDRHGRNVIVRDRTHLILGIEDALVRIRPRAIQGLDVLLSLQPGGHPASMEMIGGIWIHHVRRKISS
jgi:hypothetical protein